MRKKKSLVNSHDTAKNGDHLLCIKPLAKLKKCMEQNKHKKHEEIMGKKREL